MSATRILHICPSHDRQEQLRKLVSDAGGLLVEGLEAYCSDTADPGTLRVKMAQPDAVIVSLDDSGQALTCLRFLTGLLNDVVFIANGPEEPSLIIEAMRAGVRKYVPWNKPADLVDALARIGRSA